MNEELTLAIDELRKRPRDRRWFIPVLLSDCVIPEWPIGAGETLHDIQWVSLASDFDRGLRLVLEVINHRRQHQPSHVEVKFIRVDEKPVNMQKFGNLKISINGEKIGVLSGSSVLKAKVKAQEAIEIKAECFLADYESSGRGESTHWVGTFVHEATIKSMHPTGSFAILVGYTRGKDNWVDKLLGGYYVLRMRTDTDPVVQSEFSTRRVRGVMLTAST